MPDAENDPPAPSFHKTAAPGAAKRHGAAPADAPPARARVRARTTAAR